MWISKKILTDDLVPTDQTRFYLGDGPSAIEIFTKGEINTDPDTINTDKLIQIYREYYMPKKTPTIAVQTSSGQNKKRRDTRRAFEKTNNPRKMRLQTYKAIRPTYIDIYYKQYRQKTSGETNPRKNRKPEINRRTHHLKHLWPTT